MFPTIDSPCPLKSIQLPDSGSFNCSSCNREVHDLSALNELQRREFLSQCEGKVCVKYKIPDRYKIPESHKTLKTVALAGVFALAAHGLLKALDDVPSSAGHDGSINDAEELYYLGGIGEPQSRARE